MLVRPSIAVGTLLALGEGCQTHGPLQGDGGGLARQEVSVVAPPAQPIPLRAGPPDAARPMPVRTPPVAGATVRIPAGSYHLGSTPGDPGRDPSVEADALSVDVAAYDIDALPWPNDPTQPPQTGMSREQAEHACASHGRRLCAEVEWERACRGREETMFPGGDAWDERCGRADAPACGSSYGAFAMGTRAAEWTMGDIDDRAIIRGAGGGAAAAMHRCAARRTAIASATGLEVAFRCCGGAPSSVAYPREVSRRPFVEQPMTSAQVSALIASVPELERLHLRDGLALFNPAAVTEVLNHGATTADQHPEMTFSVSPVRWSPTFGDDLLVLVAKSRVGSWVAALWVLPDGHYRHAASFLLREDPVALTLAYGSARREVAWASCWNCGGEYGAVTYTDENRVSIVQH